MSTTAKTTKASWKKAAVHEGITLPSGTVVSIKLPNRPLMIKTGQLPNTLVEDALAAQSATSNATVTREMIEQQWEYYSFLVSRTVVEPAITQEEVAEIPAEDIEMIVEFATRQRDIDAVYSHIAGLDKLDSFRKFRSLSGGFEDLEN